MPPARHVLMVRPAAFGFSPEAAATNAFQRRAELPPDRVRERARVEFDAMVTVLRAAGVRVTVVDDTPDPPKPDAVFPNNWFSTAPDGTAVLYPMAVPTRRAERRPDVVRALPGVRRVVDLSPLEADGAYLEGTGSLAIDHARRIAFACRSARTTDAGLDAFARALDFDIVPFDAVLDDTPVYHTNVVLALTPTLALLGTSCVTAGLDRLIAALSATGRDVLALSAEQVRSYGGNVLALTGAGGPLVLMSRTAATSLTTEQHARIGPSVLVDIPTIEAVGGGSARCMVAEVWEPADADAPATDPAG